MRVPLSFHSSSKNNMAALKEWCIDNHYEFIPCNLRLPYLSRIRCFLRTLAWKRQDKEGVARIVEDLECVMWNNMDTTQHRTTERVVEESVASSCVNYDVCENCHKSKVMMIASPHAQKETGCMFRCGRCKCTSYCSRKCQEAHWKYHKAFCVRAGEACHW